MNAPAHVRQRFDALTGYPGAHRAPEALHLLERYPDLAVILAAKALAIVSPAELERRAVITQQLTRSAGQWLELTGQRGACLSTCNDLLLALESENIPCIAMTGSLEIWPHSPDIGSVMFAALNTDTPIGHTWVISAPYLIVDPSIGSNDYAPNLKAIIPSVILERKVRATTPSLEAVFSADLKDLLGGQLSTQLASDMLGVNLEQLWSLLPSQQIRTETLALEYTPVRLMPSFDPHNPTVFTPKIWQQSPSARAS